MKSISERDIKPNQALALETFVKLMRAAESVSTRVHAHLADVRLSISQFGVLEALYHLGPMCQRDIAEKILKSSGNLTLVIDNLQKRGLVLRQRDQQDRRFTIIELTVEGKGLIEGFFPGHARKISGVMAALSKEELRELSRLCRKLKPRDGRFDG